MARKVQGNVYCALDDLFGRLEALPKWRWLKRQKLAGTISQRLDELHPFNAANYLMSRGNVRLRRMLDGKYASKDRSSQHVRRLVPPPIPAELAKLAQESTYPTRHKGA